MKAVHFASDLTGLLRHRNPVKKDSYKNHGGYLCHQRINHSKLNLCSAKVGPEIVPTPSASVVSREKFGK